MHPSKTVAIVVPLSTRAELCPDERISMRHLVHYLRRYDKYLIAPRGMRVDFDGFHVKRFSTKFFGSAAAHNQLLMWPQFYQTFQNYEYVLIYHLDSLVFSDQLTKWCQSGLDYIGAPWIPCPETPWVKEPKVGNGGFTLMKVESVLKALHERHRLEPVTYWLDILIRNRVRLAFLFPVLEWLRRFSPNSRLVNRPLEDLRKTDQPDIHGCNNDYFWSFQATRFLPEFKVAAVEQGLRFAFEAAPRSCFELNGSQMPFGCHAWARYDRSFWEPHLLKPEGSAGPEIGQPLRRDVVESKTVREQKSATN